jgi:hypothetical protein
MDSVKRQLRVQMSKMESKISVMERNMEAKMGVMESKMDKILEIHAGQHLNVIHPAQALAQEHPEDAELHPSTVSAIASC